MNKELQNTITLKLDGDKITSDKFSNGIDIFYKLVNEVAFLVFGRRHPIKWIVGVEKGSVAIKNKPEIAEDLDYTKNYEFFSSLQTGINTLGKEAKYPNFFNDAALGYLKELATIPNQQNGVTKIDIIIDEKESTLTPNIITNIDILLNVYPRAMGSITGKLLTLKGKWGLEVTIYDDRTQNAVNCDMNDGEFLEKALKLFGKRVYAYGLVKYDSRGKIQSMKIKKLEKFGNE